MFEQYVVELCVSYSMTNQISVFVDAISFAGCNGVLPACAFLIYRYFNRRNSEVASTCKKRELQSYSRQSGILHFCNK